MSKGKYYFDSGEEFNPDLYPKPGICLTCIKDKNPNEELLCNLTRMDQQGEDNFECAAYEKK